MARSILHCDMNNFYASVERLYDPSLFGKPVAVCGEREMRHGIVLAKSEEAKRLGVKTGDTIWQAEAKCPGLVVVSAHFERYVKYSRLARNIYCEYTDMVEPFGMDECWLDVTASRFAFGDGKSIGEALRERMKRELGLTISIGVSFNKVFAKLGSDMKKPDAMTLIPPDSFQEKVWPLPVEEMLWVGPKSARVLHRFGIHTIGSLAVANDDLLRLQFGKNGAMMKNCAAGLDATPVLLNSAEPPLKSIGHGLTTPKDLTCLEEVWLLMFALFQEVGEKLRYHGRLARGVAIQCKDRHFVTQSLQTRLDAPTDCTMTLAKTAFRLFRERYLFREPLRSLSVRAIDLEKNEGGIQLSLFTDPHQVRGETLDRLGDALKTKYGKAILRPASLLSVHLPEEGSDYIPFTAPF